MASTRFNIPIRGGNPFVTQTSDLYEAGYMDTRPNTFYQVFVKATAGRILANGTNQAGAYWKRAAFRTDSSGNITQVSTTQSVAADIEDAAGWQCVVEADTTNNRISVKVAADGTPTNWNVECDVELVNISAQP